MDVNAIYDLFFNNFRGLFFPEEWIQLDEKFSKTELFTMLLIDRYGEINMSQIAEIVNLPMSTATGMIERLVKSGYVKRERSEEDRRIVAIRLTDEGKAIITQVKEIIYNFIEKIGESLTTEEIQMIVKVIEKVVSKFSEINDNCDSHSTKVKNIRKIEIQ